VSLVHYRPPYEDEGVVCGATPRNLDFTRHFGYVTCFACRKHPTFRLDQLGLATPATDVRPPVGTIGRIRDILREYDQALHTPEDALSIIDSIVNGKDPDHG
jgi:hypothetical protein